MRSTLLDFAHMNKCTTWTLSAKMRNKMHSSTAPRTKDAMCLIRHCPKVAFQANPLVQCSPLPFRVPLRFFRRFDMFVFFFFFLFFTHCFILWLLFDFITYHENLMYGWWTFTNAISRSRHSASENVCPQLASSFRKSRERSFRQSVPKWNRSASRIIFSQSVRGL